MPSTISPNMGLIVPGIATELGPQWAADLNASLSIIDGHNHSSGQGEQVPPGGININSDLTFQDNNATNLRTVRFFPQVSAISAVSPDIGCLYEAGVDLYYNDGNGNQIRITQGGSVSGASGTITGLPSGTASASYDAPSGTFVWQQSTGIGANMNMATIILRYPGSYPTPSGNYIALEVPASISGGYAMILPGLLPSTNGAFLTESTSGVVSYTNVDNSTLAWSAGVVSVKSGGITRAQMSALGQQVSTTTGGAVSYTSTSPTTITNLTTTITTTGNPVFLSFQSSPNTFGTSFVSLTGTNPSAQFALLRDGTQIAQTMAWTGPSGSVLPSLSILNYIDTAATAATHTYTVKVNVSGASQSFSISQQIMVAYEMW